ncbi:MAG: CAP domain-containing protein, partial [Hyphomicrobiales bacterium]
MKNPFTILAFFAIGLGARYLISPASALDLNSFRAQHGRPALSVSSTLSALAYEQAHSMATRTRLDHAGFR